MTVTRSARAVAAAVESTVKRKAPASPATSPRKKVQKNVHIELQFNQCDVPKDLTLPAEFVAAHSPQFIEGMTNTLKVDPSLYRAIVHQNFPSFLRSNVESGPASDSETILSYWDALIRCVIGQQVSGHAARAIEQRFKDLLDGDVTPQATLTKSTEELRGAGLLNMKVKYVTHISEVFSSSELPLTSVEFYRTSSSEEIVEELVKLKGIGEWLAKMFALFTLYEPDVFAYDDLGVARGVARYLEVRPDTLQEVKDGVHAVEELKARLKKKGKFMTKSSKRDWTPLHDEYVKFLGLKFAPHQLAFMLVMWRLASTNIEVLENVRGDEA